MRKFRVNVNGVGYDVEVEEMGSAAAPVAAPAPVVAPAPMPAPAAPVAAPAGGIKIEAPMPGAILNVNVAVGDSVNKGDVICILEAMKMENEIVAPESGKIISVNTQKGQNVNTGDVLAVIE